MRQVSIHVDGAVAGTLHAGIAAVARTTEGYFLGWWSRQVAPMTNNEAEYQATLLGLALARHIGAQVVEIVSDSEVVVRQMLGQSRVVSQRLKRLHQEACAAAGQFALVSFRHVPRTENVLADALATEAIGGRIVKMPPAGSAGWWVRGR